MKTQFFTFLTAAIIFASPVMAQDTHHLSPIDPEAKVLDVQETRIIHADGSISAERTVIVEEGYPTSTLPLAGDRVMVQSSEEPSIFYDGITEPIYLPETTGTMQ